MLAYIPRQCAPVSLFSHASLPVHEPHFGALSSLNTLSQRKHAALFFSLTRNCPCQRGMECERGREKGRKREGDENKRKQVLANRPDTRHRLPLVSYVHKTPPFWLISASLGRLYCAPKDRSAFDSPLSPFLEVSPCRNGLSCLSPLCRLSSIVYRLSSVTSPVLTLAGSGGSCVSGVSLPAGAGWMADLACLGQMPHFYDYDCKRHCPYPTFPIVCGLHLSCIFPARHTVVHPSSRRH